MNIKEFFPEPPKKKEPTFEENLNTEFKEFCEPPKEIPKINESKLKVTDTLETKIADEFANFGKNSAIDSVVKQMYEINSNLFDNFVIEDVHFIASYINNVLNKKVYTESDSSLIISEILNEEGRIVQGVNTTCDVGLDQIEIEARKMGFDVTRGGVPSYLTPDGVHPKPITESLDQPYSLSINKNAEWQDGRKGWTGDFKTVTGGDYETIAVLTGWTKEEQQDQANRAERAKKARAEGRSVPPFVLNRRGGIWEIHFNEILDRDAPETGYRSDITGRGDSFKVFATVLDFTKQLIKAKEPSQVIIKSKFNELSRSSLYTKLVNRYAPQLGYKITKSNAGKDETGNDILIMTIEKNKPVTESKLTEARHGSVILVDFQPAYHSDDFGYTEAMENAIEYINAKEPDVSCYFNGEEVGIEDTAQEVGYHYVEMGLNEDLVYDFSFKEKTYAFLRGWMDDGHGVDEGIIIKVVRYMVMNHLNDSRDIEEEVFRELVGDDWFDELYDSDNLYIPDISIGDLKAMSGSLLGGGGRHECLKEMQLFMNAFNIRYKLVDSWIYG